MTFQDDYDGVVVETPPFTSRTGRDRGDWNTDADYKAVHRSVRRKISFYRHLWTAAIVLGLLLIIDIITGPDEFWVQWVALVWGIVLALHFLNSFVLDSVLGRDAERRMIDRELRKRKSSR